MRSRRRHLGRFFLVSLLFGGSDAVLRLRTASAQGAAAPSTEALTSAALGHVAKQEENPLGDVISLPLESNLNHGYGPDRRSQLVFNFMPDYPTELTPALNAIFTSTIPFITAPVGGSERRTGLGDVTLFTYLSPSGSGAVTWGVGPNVRLPTATLAVLGAEKWAAGPAAAVNVDSGPWVGGVLVSHLWSFAGARGRNPVNESMLQPFVNYNLPDGWLIATAPQVVANWTARAGQTFTAPIGGGIGRLMQLDGQLVAVGAEAYWNAVRPEGEADWSLRATVSLLIPAGQAHRPAHPQ